MRNLRSRLKLVIILSLMTWLTACGGGSSGSINDAEADTECVLGESTIGNCTI